MTEQTAKPPLVSLEMLYEHDLDHIKRFGEIDGRLTRLPQEIKDGINGSIERTVDKKLNRFILWFGVGGLVILFGVGMAWGSTTNQQSNNTAAIGEIKEDVKEIREILIDRN